MAISALHVRFSRSRCIWADGGRMAAPPLVLSAAILAADAALGLCGRKGAEGHAVRQELPELVE